MNTKRFALAALGAFVFIFLFEMLWHAFLMKGLYESTMHIWRPQQEANMAFSFGSQILFSLVFTFAYTKVGHHLPCKRGVAFGLFVGLLLGIPAIAAYCYLPVPLTIPLLWCVAEVLKCIGAGVIVAHTYKA